MSENIKIICRIRPLNCKEINENTSIILTFPDDDTNTLSLQNNTYTFNRVFTHFDEQIKIYECVSDGVIEDVLSGFNRTIFAYGQTASGKTYTMEGHLNDSSRYGIIPRLINDLFSVISNKNNANKYCVKVSNYEVYLDNIRDLINTSATNLNVMEDRDQIPFIKNITEILVGNADETMEIFKSGSLNRKIGGTNMNDMSSRSHSIFTIDVEQDDVESGETLRGKLFLVDLAGSESVAKSGSEGTSLEEAKEINKSLSELGNVMNALICQSPHVPYRNSKLTRILKESLGGNSKTTMIVCCSPAETNLVETKSTLQFASRALSIKNYVTVNVEISMEEIQCKYNSLINSFIKLEEENKRWRGGEIVSNDEWYTDYKYHFDIHNSRNMSKSISTPLKKPRFSQDTSRFNTTRKKTSCSSSMSPSELFSYTVEKDLEINKQKVMLYKMKVQLEETNALNKAYRDHFLKMEAEMKHMIEIAKEVEAEHKNESPTNLQFQIMINNIKNLKEQLNKKDSDLIALNSRAVDTIKTILSEDNFVSNDSLLFQEEIRNHKKEMTARVLKLKELEGTKILNENEVSQLKNTVHDLQVKVQDLLLSDTYLTKSLDKAEEDNKSLQSEIADLKGKEQARNAVLTVVEIQSDIKSNLEDYRMQSQCIATLVNTIHDKIERNSNVVNENMELKHERNCSEEVAGLKVALNLKEEKTTKLKKKLSQFNKDCILQKRLNSELNEKNMQLQQEIQDVQEQFESDKKRYGKMLHEISRNCDKNNRYK